MKKKKEEEKKICNTFARNIIPLDDGRCDLW